MRTVEHTIEVAVPVGVAYRHWTEFESFPEFMEGVEEVRRLDDTHVRWRTSRAREFAAEIVEQRPDERVAWRSPEHSGTVSFEPLGDDATRVHARLEEADADEVSELRLERDLERFKALVEAHPYGRRGGLAPPDADLEPAAHEPTAGTAGPLPRHPQAGA